MTVPPACEIERSADELRLRLSGDWRLGTSVTGVEAAIVVMADPSIARIVVAAPGLASWDTSLPLFVLRLAAASPAGSALDLAGLPDGAGRLVSLAWATKTAAALPKQPRGGFLERLGCWAIDAATKLADVLAFIGDVVLALGRLVRGRSQMRARDLALAIEDAGARALPIVTLVSGLIGVVLAFVGASQLQLFGAEIFVANLVAVGMLREMGAMMPAIVAAGRSGAAFAAEIGTMQVDEELDALRTMAIDPVEFLVLPRFLAMTLMLPLLAVYANLLGIAGGALMAWLLFGIVPLTYVDQAMLFLGLDDLASGLLKALAFGVIVAMTGCYLGLRCGRDAAAVGRATTAAVVTGIVGIVVADSCLTVLYYVIGF